MRVILLLLVAATVLLGETFKLYLKDGSYHAVREYQVQGDRVRYYSTERGEWEEIPLELVDLSKTEHERKVDCRIVKAQLLARKKKRKTRSASKGARLLRFRGPRRVLPGGRQNGGCAGSGLPDHYRQKA